MPETPWKIMPFYRAIYRTWDYLIIDGFAYPDVATHIVTTLEAMKIGGDHPSPWIFQDHLGTHLCTPISVFRENGPYPFLNVLELIAAEEWYNSSSRPLTIEDMGLMATSNGQEMLTVSPNQAFRSNRKSLNLLKSMCMLFTLYCDRKSIHTLFASLEPCEYVPRLTQPC